jgi:hypothetical protein
MPSAALVRVLGAQPIPHERAFLVGAGDPPQRAKKLVAEICFHADDSFQTEIGAAAAA